MNEIYICAPLTKIVDYVNQDSSLVFLKRGICELLDIDIDINKVNSSCKPIVLEDSNKNYPLNSPLNIFLRKAEHFGQIILYYLLDNDNAVQDQEFYPLKDLFEKILDNPIITSSMEEQKELPKELCYMLTLGIINVKFQLQVFPAQRQKTTDYSNLSDTQKREVHFKQYASILNECFQYAYNDDTSSILDTLNTLLFSIPKNNRDTFFSHITRMFIEQKLSIDEMQNTTQKKLNDLENKINNFNSRIIEIMGIILAIFSIIGFNVFTLTQNAVDFSPLELIEINLSVVLFIIVILGVTTKLLCDKVMPKSYYVLLAILIFLLIFLFFNSEFKIEVIINELKNLTYC